MNTVNNFLRRFLREHDTVIYRHVVQTYAFKYTTFYKQHHITSYYLRVSLPIYYNSGIKLTSVRYKCIIRYNSEYYQL